MNMETSHKTTTADILSRLMESNLKVARTIRRGLYGTKTWLIRRIDRLIARSLSKETAYQFRVDYGRVFRLNCETYLGGFKGKTHIHALEIGCSEGQSAIWLLENILTHPTSSVTCIDPFYRIGTEPRFDHNIGVSGCTQRVHKMKGTSEHVLPSLRDNRYDIIYIDGNHRSANVLMDAMLSWTCLKPGGILIFDDYQWQPDMYPEETPRLAIDLFLDHVASQLTVLHHGYQVIVQKRDESDAA